MRDALGGSTAPCAVGSLKTNLGHLEAAAGIAGLIKVILQLQHVQLAPHLHLQDVNPQIRLVHSRFHIPCALAAWSPEGRARLAGVSSFGFGGTNAHVLLAEAPAQAAVQHDMASDPAPVCLLPLSARSLPALQTLARDYAGWLRTHPDVPLPLVCAAAAQGRAPMAHRLAVTAASSAELVHALENWTGLGQHVACHAGTASAPFAGRVAFLFTGQGAHYATMGRNLYRTCRYFRTMLDLCDDLLCRQGYASVLDAIDSPELLDRTDIAQPALFALEYALAQTWRYWGIEPAALLGHSVGEYVAACIAGVFSIEDGLRLIARRGQLLAECPEGGMLACMLPPAEALAYLDGRYPDIELAVVNGPSSVVLAGPTHELGVLRDELAGHGIVVRELNVRRAFHSALVEPALGGLREAAGSVAHHSPQVPLVSNITGKFFAAAPPPSYWAEHARQPVQFARCIQTLAETGVTHFLEVSPDAVLTRLGPTIHTDSAAVWLPSLRRGADDATTMRSSLARLYADGAPVAWAQVTGYAHWPRLDLPTYPFERTRYWIEPAPGAAPASRRAHAVCRWQPWSNWAEPMPRRGTGFDALPGGLAATLGPIVPRLRTKHRVAEFHRLRVDFDRLAARYVVAILGDLGWHPQPDVQVETAALAAQLQVVAPYDRLLGRLLELAAEDGWLTRAENGWRVAHRPEPGDIGQAHQDLLQRYPACAAEFKLAHRCVAHTALVMHGAADPLEVLFGAEAAGWTERLYRDSPVASFYNDLVAGCVQELTQRLAGTRPVRILELGAGTGGTTAELLPVLPTGQVEYVFTDVSRLFVAQAPPRFQAFPFVHYQVLDLEQDPAVQGFADGQFDLIVAANVLHATADLRRCLRRRTASSRRMECWPCSKAPARADSWT